MRKVLALLLLLWGLATPLAAQELATLVADAVSIRNDTTLVAEGNVEVFYNGTRLRASRISFDRATDRLQIDGPIYIVDGEALILIADSASLSADLRDGILKGARLVLNQQLQLAANEISRVGGRYTQLTKAVASSCEVCAANPTPLWEIRATRIVHDQKERQLYFDHAQFRLAGVPIFYIPRLRMPDPTLKRATGFLMPSVRSTSTLGTGLKLPYFITIGESRDLTLTPYLSTGATRTVELRYREALRNGGFTFNGAITNDTLLPGEMRGYLFGSGQISLRDDYLLNFQVQAVSDPAYLLDYGYSQVDRLTSNVELTRTRRNSFLSGQILNFNSIREGEANSTQPSLVGELTYHRRFRPAFIGGEGGFRFQTYSLLRTSQDDGVGRDVTRASARIDYRRNWVLPGGIAISGLGEITSDLYGISQDASFAATVARTTPVAAVELRWPWVRQDPGGASHVIEPVLQLVYSPNEGNEVPNEDSALVEFDEGNLFALNRFPGADATERGLRANLGIGWTRYDPAGWSLGVTVGRVFRAEDFGQFSPSSGLDGKQSDWLAAVQIVTDTGWTLINRSLFEEDFDFSKNELRLAITGERGNLGTSYVWLEADPAENRPDDTSEWAMDASYRFRSNWIGLVDWRYDFAEGRAASAGLGLQYRNECITLDLSIARRFTSSTSVEPTTDFGLSVELVGFGEGKSAGLPRRGCR